MTSTELHERLQPILSRIATDADSKSAFTAWLTTPESTKLEVDALAVEIARAYVNGRIDFSAASAALTSVMVWCNWEAPATFWEFFVAFEDLETHEDPGPVGMSLIGKVLDRHERAELK